jgi:5-methylthioadenosine/S-adenosylhomocysteine deaminase
MHPFQDNDIAPLDAVIQRAKTKHVDSVIIGGEMVYEKGRFVNVDRNEILDTIATALSKPRTQDEIDRRWLRDKVFHEVQNFYQNYLDEKPARVPFYGNSSRT